MLDLVGGSDSRLKELDNCVVKYGVPKREILWYKANPMFSQHIKKIDENKGVIYMYKYTKGNILNLKNNNTIVATMSKMYFKLLPEMIVCNDYSSLKSFVFEGFSEESYCKTPKNLLGRLDNILNRNQDWSDYPQYKNQHGDLTPSNVLISDDKKPVLIDPSARTGYDLTVAKPLQSFLGCFEEIVLDKPRDWGDSYKQYITAITENTDYTEEYLIFMTAVCILRRLKYEVDNPKIFNKLIRKTNEILDLISLEDIDPRESTANTVEELANEQCLPIFVMSHGRANAPFFRRILNKSGVKYNIVVNKDEVDDYKVNSGRVIGITANSLGDRIRKTIKMLHHNNIERAIIIEDDITVFSIRVMDNKTNSLQMSYSVRDTFWVEDAFKLFSRYTKQTNCDTPIMYPTRKEFSNRDGCCSLPLKAPTTMLFGCMGIHIPTMVNIVEDIPKRFNKHQFDWAIHAATMADGRCCLKINDVLIGEGAEASVIGDIPAEERRQLLESIIEYYSLGDLIKLGVPKEGSNAHKRGLFSSRLHSSVQYYNIKKNRGLL